LNIMVAVLPIQASLGYQVIVLRWPREFELPGDDAIMRKDGNKLIIEAVAPRSLIALLATLEPLDEGFPPIPDETPDAVEI
jgi:antitoxin VapB